MRRLRLALVAAILAWIGASGAAVPAAATPDSPMQVYTYDALLYSAPGNDFRDRHGAHGAAERVRGWHPVLAFADDSCTSQLAAAVPGGDVRDKVLTGAAAVADVATMGASQTVRSAMGLGGAINECSTAYKATIGVATVASLAVPVLGGARFAVTKATQLPAMAAKAARALPEAVAAARSTATTAKEATKVWAAARAEKAKGVLNGLASRTRLTTTSRADNAAESVPEEATTLYRAVGQHEADDIATAGGYRNAPGLEGRYFFRTRQQAEQYGQMMNKAPGFGAPNYLTSGSVPTRLLSSAEDMEAGTEGPGLFFRGDPSSFFNVFNHGLIP